MSRKPESATRKKRVAVLQDECRDDLRHWVDTNRKIALRALDLIEAAMRDPYTGIGKPEHLKQLGGNVWSRRITDVDRLVYEVFDDRIEFLQARYHYG
jgi:toxin YoeB